MADAKTTLLTAIQGNLGYRLAGTIAHEMVNAAALFVTDLVNWVTSQYTQLVGRGGHGDEVWKLLCQSVRAVF